MPARAHTGKATQSSMIASTWLPWSAAKYALNASNASRKRSWNVASSPSRIARASFRVEGATVRYPVSYTHLTLPTICSV